MTDPLSDVSADVTSSTMELEEIITRLNRPYNGKLPVEALRAAQARREEIIPYLIKLLQEAVHAAEDGNNEVFERQGHFFAIFLLGEFQAKEALPVIWEAMSLPGDLPHDLFGDVVTEILPRLLAALADDELDRIGRSIEDEKMNVYVRWSMASVYQFLVRDGKLSREEAVQRLRRHLVNVMEREKANSTLIGGLVSELTNFSPHEAQEEIENAFKNKLVDTFLLNERNVAEDLREGEKRFQERMQRCPSTGIQDTVEELSHWGAFRETTAAPTGDKEKEVETRFGVNGENYIVVNPTGDEEQEAKTRRLPVSSPEPPSAIEPVETIRNTEPRIGRNDPCPCGSGKKFKKCCGKP